MLAAALTGRTPAALNCTPPRTTAAKADAAKVRAELVRTFGKDVLPAKKPSPGDGKTAAGASATSTVSVPVRAARASGDDDAARRGWELAHWAVAQSEALRLDEVAYAGRVWKAGSGWRTEHTESGTTEVRMRLAR